MTVLVLLASVVLIVAVLLIPAATILITTVTIPIAIVATTVFKIVSVVVRHCLVSVGFTVLNVLAKYRRIPMANVTKRILTHQRALKGEELGFGHLNGGIGMFFPQVVLK
jgi:hypothetical protein